MPHRRGRKRTGGYRALPLSSCEEVAHALVRFLLFSEINFLIAPHATTRRPAVLLSFPVPGRRGKDGLTARRFWCPVERVRGRPPDGIVGRRPMRLQCCLVPINFVEIVDVLVLRVLKAQGAGAARITRRVTVNPGVVHGGLKVNMVASACTFEVDIRLPNGLDAPQILAEIDKIVATYPEVSYRQLNYSPPSWCPPDTEMAQLVRANAKQIAGIDPVPAISLGGTDARLWRHKDTPATVHGPSPLTTGRVP